MRLKSSIWVAAYLRRCSVEGAFAAVWRHGADEAGAIFIKINRLDGTGTLYGPAPQSVFAEARPADRYFNAMLGNPVPILESEIDAHLGREVRFDTDIWIIEIEDRSGHHFLDDLLK